MVHVDQDPSPYQCLEIQDAESNWRRGLGLRCSYLITCQETSWGGFLGEVIIIMTIAASIITGHLICAFHGQPHITLTATL